MILHSFGSMDRTSRNEFPAERRSLAFGSAVACFLLLLLICAMDATPGWTQGTDTALLVGTVKDTSGAVIPEASVTITRQATGVSTRAQTDNAGRYSFNYLRPGLYTLRVEKTGFETWMFTGLSLRVGTQTDEDVTLRVGSTQQTVQVKGAAPLLNTVSAALGTTVSNQYLMDLPLINLDITSLAYLSAGVTQISGADSDTLGGTGIVSNGQRYGTAEFRLDGVLATRPEGGEGGTTDVGYLPAVDALEEYRVQNNNMSAEYGNNGGTVINIVTKAGTNQFHGSGYYFLRRPGLDANDFFSNQAGAAKGSYAHDQYGGSIGGPIKRDKAFFFFDYERFRDNSPFTINQTVPTILERNGDFSQTFNSDGSLQQIYNPFQVSCTPLSGGGQNCIRQPFAGNRIPATMMDPVGAKLVNLYPQPNGPGVGPAHLFNFTDKLVQTSPSWQFDIRADEDFSSRNRLTGRYSQSSNLTNVPDPFLTPVTSGSYTHDIDLEDTWTLGPTLLWVNRIGVVRDSYPEQAHDSVNPLTIGFPKAQILNPWYNEAHFPTVNVDNYATLAGDNGCCTDTVEGDTQWMFDSTVTKMHGAHSIKFGGEWREFFNNFFQPDNTSGTFHFGQGPTMQSVFSPDFSQGNSLASMLLGWPNSNGNSLRPHVANQSSEGGAFVLDDWRATSRLTVNVGLRWEWSVPYTERYNHNMFTCFTCASGITVPALGLWPGGELYGTTILAAPHNRHANADYNDIGPRLGLAYRLTNNTVIHVGAGVYYGMNFATNWQYGGYAWQADATSPISLDGGITRLGTIETPYPLGFNMPQQGKYGPLSEWGYGDANHGSDTFQTPNVYQWNFGVQHQWSNMMLEVDYVGNRSTHDPWNYSTENRDFISAPNRLKYGTAGLAQLVPNPFLYLFQGPHAIFNAPGSIYNDATIPLINILRPYPQFNGDFEGFPLFVANSSYHSLQVRFEKRAAHGLSFLGNYTFSKFIDNSDAGGNAWIGGGNGAGLGFVGSPQDFTNLRLEKSVSANDTPQRLVFAVVYDLPVGHGERFGSHMNRVLDEAVGGWRVTPFVTFQTGQPIAVNDANQLISDGNQRPNLIGNPCSGASNDAIANGTANYFNLSAFSHPPDETDGTAPRYLSNCRVQGIYNLDLSVAKRFHFTESKFLEVRGEFFNALNTPRFGAPEANSADGTGFGNSGFGTISYQQNKPRGGQIGIRFVF